MIGFADIYCLADKMANAATRAENLQWMFAGTRSAVRHRAAFNRRMAAYYRLCAAGVRAQRDGHKFPGLIAAYEAQAASYRGFTVAALAVASA